PATTIALSLHDALPISQAGYQVIWLGQKSWNGVAILSKTEIKPLREDLPGADDLFTHSRYIEAFTGGVVIGCIYLPNGNPYPGPDRKSTRLNSSHVKIS